MTLPVVVVEKITDDPYIYYRVVVDGVEITRKAIHAVVNLFTHEPPTVEITFRAKEIYFDNGEMTLSASTQN